MVDAESARRFLTDTGIVVPAVNADQMRELDRIAMEETGPILWHDGKDGQLKAGGTEEPPGVTST